VAGVKSLLSVLILLKISPEPKKSQLKDLPVGAITVHVISRKEIIQYVPEPCIQKRKIRIKSSPENRAQ
jgi:hypothetical protein